MIKKVGLIGEDPNDTRSIKHLLEQQYSGLVSFSPMLKNIRGSQLDSKKILRSLSIEFDDLNPEIVIFIRDTDGVISESEKIETKQKWFQSLKPTVNQKGILLLNIFELEALIFADISTFNRMYGSEVQFDGNVHYLKEPKEQLKRKTFDCAKRFEESHCPEIFKQLNFKQIRNRSKVFSEFITDFERTLDISTSST